MTNMDPLAGASIAKLTQAMYPRVRTLAGQFGAHSVDDVTQDVMLAVVRHARRNGGVAFEGRSKLDTWLYRVVLNAVRMEFRSGVRHERIIDRGADGTRVGDDRPNAERVLVDGVERSRRVRALKVLGDAQHALLVAAATQSLEEMSASMGVQVGTLKSRISRTRARARAVLAEVG